MKTRADQEAEMTDNPTRLRASDHDRQAVVDLLRTGLEDGRLTMDEYVERMGQAYQAVTLADLAPLYADLPAGTFVAGPRRQPTPVPAGLRPGAAAGSAGCFLARLPVVLKVLWTIWLTAVSINVVVWVLVSASHGQLAYPWPLWVAGPYGALLAAVSAGVLASRSGPRPAARQAAAR
jgi:hypothetical protein